MLLRYIFEPRTNSRALGIVGSVMTIDLSMNGCSHSNKPVWREKTRLASPKVGLRRLQRLDAIPANPPFPFLDQVEDKGGSACSLVFPSPTNRFLFACSPGLFSYRWQKVSKWGDLCPTVFLLSAQWGWKLENSNFIFEQIYTFQIFFKNFSWIAFKLRMIHAPERYVCMPTILTWAANLQIPKLIENNRVRICKGSLIMWGWTSLILRQFFVQLG